MNNHQKSNHLYNIVTIATKTAIKKYQSMSSSLMLKAQTIGKSRLKSDIRGKGELGNGWVNRKRWVLSLELNDNKELTKGTELAAQ